MKTMNASVWQYNNPMRSNELYHYASPYYDPVKAHEYYMAHRVLKGRRVTTGLNKEGREIAKVVKENINKEQSEKSKELRSEASKRSESNKAAIQSEIASIRAKLKGMSKEERAKNKPQALRDIKDLRNQIKMQQAGILSRLGVDLTNLNKEYDNKYYAEIERLKSHSATSTAKTNTSKSAATTSSDTKTDKEKKPKTKQVGRTSTRTTVQRKAAMTK